MCFLLPAGVHPQLWRGGGARAAGVRAVDAAAVAGAGAAGDCRRVQLAGQGPKSRSVRLQATALLKVLSMSSWQVPDAHPKLSACLLLCCWPAAAVPAGLGHHIVKAMLESKYTFALLARDGSMCDTGAAAGTPVRCPQGTTWPATAHSADCALPPACLRWSARQRRRAVWRCCHRWQTSRGEISIPRTS